MVQWLRIHLAMQGDVGLIPDWGATIPHARATKAFEPLEHPSAAIKDLTGCDENPIVL